MIINLFNNIHFLEFGAIFFAVITVLCNFYSIALNVKRKKNSDEWLNNENSTFNNKTRRWKKHSEIGRQWMIKRESIKKLNEETTTLIIEMNKEDVPLEKIKKIANNSGITDETLNTILTKSDREA